MSASRMDPQTPPPPGLPDGPLAPNPYPYPWGGALPYPAPVAGYGWGPPAEPPARTAWMGFGGETPRWGMPDILLGLLAWLVLQILVVIPVVAVTNDKTVLSIVGLLGGWLGMAGYVVFISHRKGLRSVRRDFGWDFRWVD